MSDESDDSVDTVISALDSRLLQSLSASDSLSPEDVLPKTPTSDSGNTEQLDAMGNRHGGDKKKKKEDEKHTEKPEDKPKRKGKRSKGKSKRHSQHVEGEGSSGHGPGACASPSSSSSKPKSKRPDVLADLGTQASGSPLGSPGSSQGTWSHDDESDVSTVGYSTPLLSTPQVQRYVLPKQSPVQTSTERLEELGRSIERTIIDNLSDRPPGEEGAAAASPPSTTSTTESKGKRNVKKKRALGQAVLDSDSFTLPLQDIKHDKAATVSPQAKRLNVGSEKISLRASQECPVSPWLRDDDTPIDEEQMDEMFISCIDLSYNLADICSEKEFTEYGSLESRKQTNTDSSRSKETSLSPRIARKTVQSNSSPLPKRVVSKIKAADSRDTPPKSDSSTSTLAEIGLDTREEARSLDCLDSTDISGRGTDTLKQSAIVEADTHEHSVTTSCVINSGSGAKPKDAQKTKKSGKSKKKSKKKKNRYTNTSVTDIPLIKESSDSTGVSSGDKGNIDSASESPGHTTITVNDNLELSAESAFSKAVDNSQAKLPVTDSILDQTSTCLNSEKTLKDKSQISEPLLDMSKYTITKMEEQVQDNRRNTEAVNEDISDESNTMSPEVAISDVSSDVIKSISDSKSTNEIENGQPLKDTSESATSESVTSDGKVDDTKQGTPERTDQAGENLSPSEPASPKHVPPPSPSAMDALAEVDEEDEEALDSLEQTTQLNEVQLFGETVFKRLSSLVESQSQDEDIDDRFKDFSDSVDPEDADPRPVNLGTMGLVGDDLDGSIGTKTPEVSPEHEVRLETSPPKEIVEETILPATVKIVERSVVSIPAETIEDVSPISMKKVDESYIEDKDGYIIDDGTLKSKKKRKSGKKKSGKDKSKSKNDTQGNVVRKPEIPVELKQVENTHDSAAKTKSDEGNTVSETYESEKENSPPKRESQQIQDVIEAYGLENIVGVSVEKLSDDHSVALVDDNALKESEYLLPRPLYESDDDSDDSCDSRSRSSGDPSTSSLEVCSRRIPEIEETFSELLSVKHILEDLEDRTPTEETLPSFISSEGLRSPPDYFNSRRSRMSPAITDRTESDLDISEQRDDISTDSMYADDEDDGASEVLFSRSYSEPDGNEVVVSCTFYNTQHNNNTNDSDDFWEDYTTADESFKQIEISADAASSTFQNARKQMHDIHQHLQDLRRQMEHLQEEVEHATLTPEYSMDSEDKRPITE
ncbi:dentin sialophosphoprotein-like [Haliotis rubra]|uniref:dentin sialophosphoprotein-like n=1 Tax=Haliotis rubra TaxID=36100 RepID=UPI001EE51F88|nr:dentin sialophosphoprotein-like [Haliotis rubra]XP_046565181.1 dentin sialophosphoprotein-like [Haliotis rubra]